MSAPFTPIPPRRQVPLSRTASVLAQATVGSGRAPARARAARTGSGPPAPRDGCGPTYAFSFSVERGERAGLTVMRDHFNEPDIADVQDYIADRASMLNKVFTDQVIWEQSLQAFASDASLTATWVDHEGEEHCFAINRVYLKAHLKVVRSLMNDLIACGDEGKNAVRGIIALQVSMFVEEETR